MSNNLIEVSRPEEHYNVNYTRILKYSVEMSHSGLNEYKILTAPELNLLLHKTNAQIEKWIEKWEKIEAKRMIAEEKEANIDEAKRRTKEAENALKQIDNLLLHTIDIDDTIDWDSLKSSKSFPEKNPKDSLQNKINKLPKPERVNEKKHSKKPDEESEIFLPQLSFWDKIFSSKRIVKENIANEKYLTAINNWKNECKQIDEENKKHFDSYQNELNNYNKRVESYKYDCEKQTIEWKKRKEIFFEEQSNYNLKVDQMKLNYFKNDVDAILEYCEMVLNNSKYPISFLQSFELEYNPKNKILIVEYQLPSIESFPKLKEVKYIATKKELKESYISESQLVKMFDEAMYKITFRSIHELFEADSVNAIEAISFNGWVKSINKATGKEENNCILTIQVKKNEFLEIDLSRIDPKISFRNLKGIASSKLSSLTPVQPILQLTKTDKRFVEGYNVVDGVDNSINLAAMNWEDFENLIREIFEKEFMTNGGEVKVTQASRDGGVDAIAFDPDPIRGGKIVIQAKRYTNTVGVSAVRDLYGTVMNEGATKGLLVTTADYGPDAYQFAKDKPLTLLNGSNLLHLLEKHGHHAKIDIREAKKIIAEQEQL